MLEVVRFRRRTPRFSARSHVAATTTQDASEILYFHAHLKRRNDAASKEVDAVFMERTEREKGVHRLEEQVRLLRAQYEAAGLSRSAPAAAHSIPLPFF